MSTDSAGITYKPLPGEDQATAVYLDKRRVGTIVRLTADRWQYLTEGRSGTRGDILPSLQAVKRSLEAE